MLMIVLVHLTGNGVLKSEAPISYTESNWILANIIDALAYPAVNTFVIISGYFGIRLSLLRVLKLDIPVIIYSVALYLLFETATIGGTIWFSFPILTNEYWFLTAYFLLMLISPFLNAYIETKNQHQLFLLLFWSVLLMVIVPSFSPLCLSDPRGMDVINFGVLYIVGRSIAQIKISISIKKSLFIYTLSSLTAFSLTLVFAYYLGINRGWQSHFYSYNNILVFSQAIALFFIFKQVIICERLGRYINWLAPSFFFVYIIHSHPSVHKQLYYWISSSDFYFSDLFFLHTIGWGVIIFSICIIIDITIRRWLLNSFINATINSFMKVYDDISSKFF